jgi:hypothetical protein
VKLSDRIRRWWRPAKWRDERPEDSDGEGFALDSEPALADTAGKDSLQPRNAVILDRQH